MPAETSWGGSSGLRQDTSTLTPLLCETTSAGSQFANESRNSVPRSGSVNKPNDSDLDDLW